MGNDIIFSPTYMAVPGNIYHSCMLVDDDDEQSTPAHSMPNCMTAKECSIIAGAVFLCMLIVALATAKCQS